MITVLAVCAALAAIIAVALIFAPRAEIVTQIDISASPDEVWRVLADTNAYPDWNPFLVRMDGGLVEGAVLTNTMQPSGGAAMTFRPTILTVVPGRELRWLGRLFLPRIFDGEHYFLLQRQAEGTRLVHGEKFAGILLWFIDPTRFKPDFEAMNHALRTRVEASIVRDR